MFRFVLCLALSACPALAAEPPSYLNEVIPVLTKAGCNQGACHGKGVRPWHAKSRIESRPTLLVSPCRADQSASCRACGTIVVR